MPSKPREFEVGEIYHVLNRGVEKRDIFMKPQDYSRFILGLEMFNGEEGADIWQDILSERKGSSDLPRRLAEWRSKRGKQSKSIVDLLAFCLMPNHFHLIVREISDGGIIAFMRKMAGYTVYFNKQHNRVGPLFQGRYKAIRIKKDTQLDVIFSYVHTNPVELWEPGWRKNGVQNADSTLARLKEYRWSSFLDYLGQNNFSHATQRDFFMDYFEGKEGCLEEVKSWLAYKGKESGFFAE